MSEYNRFIILSINRLFPPSEVKDVLHKDDYVEFSWAKGVEEKEISYRFVVFYDPLMNSFSVLEEGTDRWVETPLSFSVAYGLGLAIRCLYSGDVGEI